MVFWLCGRPTGPKKPPGAKHEWDVLPSASHELESLRHGQSPPSCEALYASRRQAANASGRAAVNAALSQVGNLVQAFAKMRSESSSSTSMQKALQHVLRDWPGAFACIHVASAQSGKAMMLASAAASSAGSMLSKPRVSARCSLANVPQLVDLRRPSSADPPSAISAAMGSADAFFCWVKALNLQPPPSDYVPFTDAGAEAVATVTVKLTGDLTAALTMGYLRPMDAEALHAVQHLWPTYLKVAAAGLYPLLLETSVPRYLHLATELSTPQRLDDAMLCAASHLSGLADQASHGLWFRLALNSDDGLRVVLFDFVPEDSCASPHHRPILERLSTRVHDYSTRRSSQALCASRRDTCMSLTGDERSVSGLPRRHSSAADDEMENDGGGANAAVAVARTVVAMENCILLHAMSGNRQVLIPDIHKMLNHGGDVAADVFVSRTRPPASMLLLPLVKPRTKVAAAAAGGNFDDGDRFPSSFGGVYCISNTPTDFASVKQSVRDAVVKVLSPHLHAALAQEPLASEYMKVVHQKDNGFVSPSDHYLANESQRRSPSNLVSYGSVGATADVSVHRRSPTSLQTCLETASSHTLSTSSAHSPTAAAAATAAGGCASNADVARAATEEAGAGSSGGGDSSSSSLPDICCSIASPPSSCTDAVVMELVQKIAAHRMSNSLSAQRSRLGDLQLLGICGAGGYGHVFTGKWRGMQAAIKVVVCPNTSDLDSRRLVLKHAHEIAIVSAVSHPNIVQAYDFLTNVKLSEVIALCTAEMIAADRATVTFKELNRSASCLCHIEVLELCSQGTLADAVRRRAFTHGLPPPPPPSTPRPFGALPDGPPSPKPAVDDGSSSMVVKAGGAVGTSRAGGDDPSSRPCLDMQSMLLSLLELASALAHLHSLGIMHCDVKPDNVFLASSTQDARGFTVMLGDFGLSRVQNGDMTAALPCNSCGTLAYTSPEALLKQNIDAATDVYSFGMVMFQLYVTHHAWFELDSRELFERVVHGRRPQFPSGSHSGYAQLTRACWHADSAQRPDFEHVVGHLQRLMASVKKWPAPLMGY